jgi:hypothetical protein
VKEKSEPPPPNSVREEQLQIVADPSARRGNVLPALARLLRAIRDREAAAEKGNLADNRSG